MKTSEATFSDLASSVVAVPPLARQRDGSVSFDQNAQLIRYLEAGGVTTLLYGGNANVYNIGLDEYANLLDSLVSAAAADTWLIPSVGPAYGTMMAQAEILKDMQFPTAMVLPTRDAVLPRGVELGLRRFSVAFGKPIVVYLKYEEYLSAAAVERLVDDGVVSAIKYAIVREDPAEDDYLAELCDHVDKRLIVSGIGEPPAVVHMRRFGLDSFTSGCVCLAPRQSMRLLGALQQGDSSLADSILQRFLPMEKLRDEIHPIAVLHDAVTLAGISEMGPIMPLLSNLDESDVKRVREAAVALATGERATAQVG